MSAFLASRRPRGDTLQGLVDMY